VRVAAVVGLEVRIRHRMFDRKHRRNQRISASRDSNVGNPRLSER
jgi:hypothetical protein